MSISLTLRRAYLSEISGLSGDDAVEFCYGLEGDGISSSNDIIQFFAPWHIVHFLSSGTEWDQTLPSGFMIGGSYWAQGHPEEEPTRLLSSNEVQAAFNHLKGLSEDLISERLALLSSGSSKIYGCPLAKEDFIAATQAMKMIMDFFEIAANEGMVISKGMS